MAQSLLKQTVRPWTLVQVGEARARVGDATAACRLGEVLALLQDEARDALERFFLILRALELDAVERTMSATAWQKLVDIAQVSLRFQGVPVTGDELSFLHGLVVERVAERDGTEHRSWSAATGSAFAAATGHVGSPAHALRVGQASDALNGYQDLVRRAQTDEERWRARFGALQAARFAGSGKEALRLADDLALQIVPGDAERQRALDWQRLLINAQTSGDATPLVPASRRGHALRTFRNLLTVSVWTYALPESQRRAEVPSPRGLREALAKELNESPSDWAKALEAFGSLVSAHDPEIPLTARVAAVGGLLDLTPTLPSLELELLFLAAAARWLDGRPELPLKQLAVAVHAQYRGKCLTASGGMVPDLFRVLEDFGRAAHLPALTPAGLKDQDFHWLANMLKLSALSAGTAKSIAKSKAKSLIASDAAKKKIKEAEIEEHAQRLQWFLRDAKGTFLKIAQVSAFVESTTPPKIAAVFKDLQVSARPLDHTLSRQIVENELSKKIEEVYGAWDVYPIGVGSLGQVHRAALKDGTPVAVKVQYPQMRDQVRRQVTALRFLAPAFQFFYPALDLKRVLAEVENNLLTEMDYKEEARLQTLFREKLNPQSLLRIPMIFAEHSTARVITMELFQGARCVDFADGASQEARNQAGEEIVKALFELRYLHGLQNFDPHPGNFLFANDFIGFFDFGSSTSADARVTEGMRGLYKALRYGGRTELRQFLEIQGFVGNPRDFDDDAAFAQLKRDFEPYVVDKPFRFSQDYLNQNFHDVNKNIKNWSIPPHWLGQFRWNISLHALLASLGAESNWHQLVGPLMDS